MPSPTEQATAAGESPSTASPPPTPIASLAVPDEIALLDSAPYRCVGSKPLSSLWYPANAEGGSDPAAAALRTIVGGQDPKSAGAASGFPTSGWQEIDRSPDRVTYLHTSGPPYFRDSAFVIVKRAADGSWAYGGLGSGGSFRCWLHTDQVTGAHWQLAARPSPSDRTLQAEVQLPSCGRPSPSQVVPRAHAFYGPALIDIIVTTPPIDTEIGCSAWYPLTITLDQPIGHRTLFDASAFPLVQRWPKS
jgi:hypothetical protein